MTSQVWGLIGALIVLVAMAFPSRGPWTGALRSGGFAVGFVVYVITELVGGPGEHSRVKDATYLAFVVAGFAQLARIMVQSQRRRADPAYDPEAAATAGADGLDSLHQYFGRGDLDALDRSVELLRRSVQASQGHPAQLTHVINLMTGLHARYSRRSQLGDLEEAVDTARTAVSRETGRAVQRGLVLALRCSALRLRYERIGAVADLDASREDGARAVQLVPFGSRYFARCNTEYAEALRTEYDRGERLEFLELAIDRIQRNLIWAYRRDTVRAEDLTALCTLLAESGRRRKSREDLDEAVEAGRQALRKVSSKSRQFQPCQNNLAIALRTRYDLRHRIEDLDEAIRLAQQAAESVPADAPQRAEHLLNLALALHGKYLAETTDRATADRTLAQAIQAASEAAQLELGDVVTRVRAGLAWSEFATAAGRYADAVTAFEQMIELLPQIAADELDRYDQEDRLGLWAGFAANAAASALAAGNQEKALVLLEQARGVLLSRDLDFRADLTSLRAKRPALAAEFEHLRALRTVRAGWTEAELQTFAQAGNPLKSALVLPTAGDRQPGAQAEDWEDVQRRMRQAQTERWDDLLRRIRAEAGFADFAGVPSAGRILEQGRRGPVVYVNVSDVRSDAIILQPEGVVTVPLRITPRQAADQNRRLQHALRPENLTDLDRQQDVHDVLGWLWDEVAEPVLDASGIEASAEGSALPRIWWIPIGVLAQLPIHAAGHHRSGEALLDRAVSSYAPTVRALAAVRDRKVIGTPPHPLVVAMGVTPGAEALAGAEAEAGLVRELFPGSQLVMNEEATRQRVLAELPQHSWVHFACHGVADRRIPSRGRLLLHDHAEHPLTVADISGLELPSAAVAYLSACETAHTATRHADEAIHLASAFQVAGFSDVVATLWRIPDRVARDLAENTYSALLRRIRAGATPDVASAVHEATREVRTMYPNLPGLWTGFVHLGR